MPDEEATKTLDTEILGETGDLEQDLKVLVKEETTSSARTARGKTGRPRGCFSQLKSTSQMRKRVAPRVEGIMPGTGEAVMLLRRLHREYPETRQGSTVSNLSLLVMIRSLGLSYNKLVDMRFWIMDELSKGTDLSSMPPARKIMAMAYASTLPAMPPMGDMAASVPLQSLLDKTSERLLACSEVCEYLEDGAEYELLLKSGNDGQSGRGNFSHKPKEGVKKVNDDRM